MIQETFFYRAFSSPEFEKCAERKRIVPVRLKNPFRAQGEYYDENSKKWLPLPKNPAENEILSEYADKPDYPNPVLLYGDGIVSEYIEDMDENQVSLFLRHRLAFKKWKYDSEHFRDEKGVEKDFVAALIQTDDESLSLTVKFTVFSREDESQDEPKFSEKILFFDMKNGTARFSNWEGTDETVSDRKYYDDYKKGKLLKRKVTPFARFYSLSSELYKIEGKQLPFSVLLESYKALTFLAEKFTGFDMSALRENPPGIHILNSMYKLTLLPYEPKLCDVVFSEKISERKIRFNPKRTEPNIYNKFCKKAKIKTYRTLRKCYEEKPESLFTYLSIKDCGFKDLNLYNRVFESKKNSEIFDEVPSEFLRKFSSYSIKKRGELCTMNTILKGDDGDDFYEKRDAIEMFAKYFKIIPETLKKDILLDGFTTFNHDALSNIAYQVENKNFTFSHSPEEKKLEDSVNGFEFRLPKDSYELCRIGTSLHNCVATYASNVRDKKCTIIYASLEGEYKICIEIRGNEVWQERADHNEKPDKTALAALDEWRRRHNLVLL